MEDSDSNMSQPTSHLLALPAELRIRILEYVFALQINCSVGLAHKGEYRQQKHITSSFKHGNAHVTALLMTNKLLYMESLPMLFDAATFHVLVASYAGAPRDFDGQMPLQDVFEKMAKYLRRMSLRIVVSGQDDLAPTLHNLKNFCVSLDQAKKPEVIEVELHTEKISNDAGDVLMREILDFLPTRADRPASGNVSATGPWNSRRNKAFSVDMLKRLKAEQGPVIRAMGIDKHCIWFRF